MSRRYVCPAEYTTKKLIRFRFRVRFNFSFSLSGVLRWLIFLSFLLLSAIPWNHASNSEHVRARESSYHSLVTCIYPEPSAWFPTDTRKWCLSRGIRTTSLWPSPGLSGYPEIKSRLMSNLYSVQVGYFLNITASEKHNQEKKAHMPLRTSWISQNIQSSYRL